MGIRSGEQYPRGSLQRQKIGFVLEQNHRLLGSLQGYCRKFVTCEPIELFGFDKRFLEESQPHLQP